MLLDTYNTLIAVLTIVLMAISLFFTILLIKFKPSTEKMYVKPETRETYKKTEDIEQMEETKTTLKLEKTARTRKKPRSTPHVKGCRHYVGYLERLSVSSFPYECLACPKMGTCMGERKEERKKGLERSAIDMSEYAISARIDTTIQKAKRAPWKDWRGKSEQAIRAEEVPELYELLKELGGKIKHENWEYHRYEKPLNMVVRTRA